MPPMKAVAVTFVSMWSLLIIACSSTIQDRPSTGVETEVKTEAKTEVEKAKKKLSDLNATQIQVTKKLIEKRNLLLSMPQDSPPTREISRQIAILNKQAGNLVSQVFAAELALEKAISAEADRKKVDDANATATTPESSVSGPDVPTLPGTKPEPTKPEPTKPEPTKPEPSAIDENAVDLVKATMMKISSAGRSCKIGPLEGGAAVLVDGVGAYWVKNGTVYVANGLAKMWSPAISYSTSAKITFNTVKSACSQAE